MQDAQAARIKSKIRLSTFAEVSRTAGPANIDQCVSHSLALPLYGRARDATAPATATATSGTPVTHFRGARADS